MTRQEKIAAIRAALSEEQRQWLREIIEDAYVVKVTWCGQPYHHAPETLHKLAEEFK